MINSMKLRLFNSLGKKITETNLDSQQPINIYLCGPTVYDHIHLGNLRPIIIFDVLYRLLLYLKIKVNYVQNITDIDDKIIAKAEKEKKSERHISNHYARAYFDNLINYNVLLPSIAPRVTNYIPQIKNFIDHLLKKGKAYHQAGEIFFRISENNEYGILSGQDLKKLKSVREIKKARKENNDDFVL